MKYLLALLILSILFSCNNHRRKSDQILRKFDSVNLSLKKTNESIGLSTDALYDSIAKKYSETFLQQFRYSVSGFKDYMHDLKHRFIVACGDSTGEMLPPESEVDISRINNFFLSEKSNAKYLLPQLEAMQKTFFAHTSNPELKEQISHLVPPSKEKDGFMKAYFYDVPPVAALTILSKFENDISNIENKILQEYLSK
ncbi:MAG TPA: hypothetical protein VK483_00640 [Chitinophagaceae bacterium]|nr:hypothetical protein [Chitinophagaceae bacterium]